MLELSFGKAITFIRNTAHIEASSTEETLAKQLYNYYNTRYLSMRNLDFTERVHTLTTTASTDTYILPRALGRIRTLKFTVGSNQYVVNPVRSIDEWTQLKDGGSTADIPTHYMLIYNATNQLTLQLHPTPNTSSLTVTIYYTLFQAEMTADDYTTGTVDTVTNASGTVTGDTTVWTAAMIGRWIQLPDNYWYQITARASNTSITVTPLYQGVSLTTGAAKTYTLGEKSLLPPAFCMLPAWCAIRDIEAARSNPSPGLMSMASTNAQNLEQDMFATHSRRNASGLIDEPRQTVIVDPNDPTRITIT